MLVTLTLLWKNTRKFYLALRVSVSPRTERTRWSLNCSTDANFPPESSHYMRVSSSWNERKFKIHVARSRFECDTMTQTPSLAACIRINIDGARKQVNSLTCVRVPAQCLTVDGRREEPCWNNVVLIEAVVHPDGNAVTPTSAKEIHRQCTSVSNSYLKKYHVLLHDIWYSIIRPSLVCKENSHKWILQRGCSRHPGENQKCRPAVTYSPALFLAPR